MSIKNGVKIGTKILSRCVMGVAAAAFFSTSGFSATLQELRAQLPERILKDGLTVAFEQYIPDNYLDPDGKPSGWAIEILSEAAKTLDMPIRFIQVAQFQSLLPGIDAERYDLAVSGFAVTEERKQRYDFVSYFNAGNSIIIHKDHAEVQPDDMCGLKASIAVGSYFNKVVDKYSEKCVADGKPKIEVMTFPSGDAMYGALSSKRADFTVGSLSSSAYIASRSEGQFLVSGSPFFRTISGFVFNKKNTQARDAVAAGVQELVNNGKYAEILSRWNLSGGALTKVEINP